ncbi:ATP-grasp domain-containing protein [Bacillus bingmayongensis]|uniref:ATP-grasp domain-containing protein n=2 Tax=Bacillus TaxID=1386 RepID=UPI0002E8FE19|nr:ATP-grasp domain-containing protein [Bacillus bingmayongensis]MBY0596508.1 ATP-grasp domain-containing protein [Bacillus bingmayongensis]MBY0596847.1 ATP-grasp domain-containing protein [Bacillus bingmayongensis]
MSLLIVNPMDDFHCNYLMYKLKKRNISFTELGPVHSNEYSFIDNKLIYNGKVIDIDNVRSIFIRSNMIFTPQLVNTPYIDTYNEQMQFKSQIENLRSWLQIMQLNGVRMINPPADHSKYFQLYKLIHAGLPIPKTCITNSYKRLEEFIKSTDRIVYKPLVGGYYCREVNGDELLKMKSLNLEPVIFQEYIEGKDIRVYTLDGEILSAHEIQRESNKSTIDYRTDPMFSKGKLNYKMIHLPSSIENVCLEAAKILGLEFSGIDLKLNNKGEFYLLECNSMPMYLDLELKNHIKITDYIINFLNANIVENFEPSFEEATHEQTEINKKSLFDYKSVYEDFYKYKSEKQKIVILPINREQKNTLKDHKINHDEEDYVILSINGKNNAKIIDLQ